MANLSLTTSSPRQRPYDAAQATGTASDLLARTLKRLNAHLAASLAATGKVRHHGRLDD